MSRLDFVYFSARFSQPFDLHAVVGLCNGYSKPIAEANNRVEVKILRNSHPKNVQSQVQKTLQSVRLRTQLMLTISNSLSFFRAPLACLFLYANPSLRLCAILLAAITDCIDGYLARRYRSTSKFGAILDPAMDKFFVYFALVVFYQEGKIVPWEVATLLSRDVFLCLYGIIMIVARRSKSILFRSVRWGKITTALQFTVLVGLVFDISFPWIAFAAFPIMGWLAFLELYSGCFKKHPIGIP